MKTSRNIVRYTIGALLLAAVTGWIGMMIGYEQGMKDYSFRSSDMVLYTTTVYVTDADGTLIDDPRFGWSDDYSPYLKGISPATIIRNSDGSISLAITGLNLDSEFELEISATGYTSEKIIIEDIPSGYATRDSKNPVIIKLQKN